MHFRTRGSCFWCRVCRCKEGYAIHSRHTHRPSRFPPAGHSYTDRYSAPSIRTPTSARPERICAHAEAYWQAFNSTRRGCSSAAQHSGLLSTVDASTDRLRERTGLMIGDDGPKSSSEGATWSRATDQASMRSEARPSTPQCLEEGAAGATLIPDFAPDSSL